MMHLAARLKTFMTIMPNTRAVKVAVSTSDFVFDVHGRGSPGVDGPRCTLPAHVGWSIEQLAALTSSLTEAFAVWKEHFG